MSKASNIIIIASPWEDSSEESVYFGPWQVEGRANSQLYCVEANDRDRGSIENAKPRIKEIIEQAALPANILFFGHHWRRAELAEVEGLAQIDRKVKAFSFQGGENYIYYKAETKQGLIGAYRLGGNEKENNAVVSSYKEPTIRKAPFEGVWNFYYYNFDREACDLSAALIQFFGTDGEFLTSHEALDLGRHLREAQQQSLLNRLYLFTGKASVGDETDSTAQLAFSSYVEEQTAQMGEKGASFKEKYEHLKTLIEDTFFNDRRLNKQEAQTALRNIRADFVTLLQNNNYTNIYE